jgi:hypothetical protein
MPLWSPWRGVITSRELGKLKKLTQQHISHKAAEVCKKAPFFANFLRNIPNRAFL